MRRLTVVDAVTVFGRAHAASLATGLSGGAAGLTVDASDVKGDVETTLGAAARLLQEVIHGS